MTRPTADQLKAWRELCDYDEGEDRGWEATEDGHVFTGDGDRVAKCQPNIAHLATAKQRAAFIAAAREAVPALLDEVDRLRRENEAMARVIDAADDEINHGLHLISGGCRSQYCALRAALDELRKMNK